MNDKKNIYMITVIYVLELISVVLILLGVFINTNLLILSFIPWVISIGLAIKVIIDLRKELHK